MLNKKSNSRRKFIKESAVVASSFFIVPRHVLGKGYIPPSDRLNLAAIGAGGKGYSDIVNASDKGANNVVALCDVDSKAAQRARDAFPKAKFYKDFRKMLDEMDHDIDAVTISTPDHVHGVAAMAAMSLGKHVYVQKPLTHNVYEARQLTEAANKYKVVTQMGNQGASHPGQVQIQNWFDKGLIGKVHTVEVWTNRPVWPQGIPVPTDKTQLPDHLSKEDWNLYIGPAEYVDYHPLYYHFKWRGWWNFGTGALGDMGCHLIDTPFKVLGLGYPTEVECSVGAVFKRDWSPEYIPEGCPPSSRVQINFPATKKNKSAIKMIWSDGGLRPFHPELMPANDDIGGKGSYNGIMLIGKKGVITADVYGQRPRLYRKGEPVRTMPKDFDGGNPYFKLPELGHHKHWTEACKAGFDSYKHRSLTSSFDYAGPLTETVLMGNLAIRSFLLNTERSDGGRNFYGRKQLKWDGKNQRITNLEEANQFVSRNYRDGWKLI
ncbi:MAG: Gfo/Idh/MocA family oxidoreductase [Bacteroidota bacterium]